MIARTYIIILFDSLIITFHAEKIADWAYQIYHTLSILRTGNNELFIFMLYTHIHIYSYMCEIPLTVAGASIIVQKISPSFQVFYFAKLVIMCYAWRNNAIFRRACGSGGWRTIARIRSRWDTEQVSRPPLYSLGSFFFCRQLSELPSSVPCPPP